MPLTFLVALQEILPGITPGWAYKLSFLTTSREVPGVYSEGTHLSATPRTPNELRPRDERLVGCRYGNRQLDIASTFNFDVLSNY